jgi:SAM-dependent methyltransferase
LTLHRHGAVREGGSFRDPASIVLVGDDDVVRLLTARGLEDWEATAATAFFQRALADGTVVRSELVDTPATAERHVAALRHERLPFVSYPYEWPFAMLRDAALLQLDLVEAALAEDVILKDASPYNVQWRGARPVFVDVGSFEPLVSGQAWVGYRQFCIQFLYPLMLQAYKGVSYRPWLRGSVRGILPRDIARLLSGRDRLRSGVFTHVHLHARLERRHEDDAGGIEADLRRAGFRKELVAANVRRLRKLVRGLEWSHGRSPWTGYRERNSYTDEDDARKVEFVARALAAGSWPLVWDLGCNDGRFARLAAARGSYVVAVDSDEAVLDALYRQLAAERNERILPLAIDIGDPSPALGWRGRERTALAQRRRPDLALCLALVHHLAITESIPLGEIVDWLAESGGAVIVEFPTLEDPMVSRLLAAKGSSATHEYGLAAFERALGERFTIDRRERLPSGTRHLFFARSRT